MEGLPRPPATAAEGQPVRGGVVLEFDMGGGANAPKQPVARSTSKNDRPWRKPAAAVKAEKEKNARILGAGGVDFDAMHLVLSVQELIDAAAAAGSSDQHASLQAATTVLLQVATNARPMEEVAAARAALEAAASAAGVAETLAKRPAEVEGRNRLQLLHEVVPRLWVGGWAALNNDCEALRSRKVTHVLSVLSADQRRLPSFIQGHHYVRVDDTEEAAATLASHFEAIVAFIEQARTAGGTVFVHCGAGISRAPTSACAYLVWKLRMRAVDALALIRKARNNVRPNSGFVAELKRWEQKVLSSPSPEGANYAGITPQPVTPPPPPPPNK